MTHAHVRVQRRRLQPRVQLGLVLLVQGARGLIQEHHRGRVGEQPRERQALRVEVMFRSFNDSQQRKMSVLNSVLPHEAYGFARASE